MDKLNQKINKELTHLANKTISKMQKVNCDGLGIGQRITSLTSYRVETYKLGDNISSHTNHCTH
ncbi:TPA: Ger(x)C family spore germination C-terminal domain-containing protein [Bacillus cereus]